MCQKRKTTKGIQQKLPIEGKKQNKRQRIKNNFKRLSKTKTERKPTSAKQN